MAYRISRKRKTGREMRRVLLEQNDKALVLLRDWQVDPAGRVHRARQAFKRLRAALRLIKHREAYVFEVENRFYRDQARRLSYVRDVAAMVEVVDTLAEGVWESLPRQSLLLLRQSLERRAEQEAAEGIGEISARVAEVCEDLEHSRQRLSRLPLQGLKPRHLRKGAQRTIRRGRSGFERACRQSSDEALHEWRKVVKYSMYQSSLLRDLDPDYARVQRPALATLADVLGHAQDLAVLDELLRAQPDTLGIDLHLQRLQWIVRKARRETRDRALGIGVQVFGRPASQSASVLPFPPRAARRRAR